MYAFASTLVLSAVSIGSATAQEMAGVRQVYDGTMRPGVEVKTFAHSDELFPVRIVERGNETRKLPKAKTPLKNVVFETGGKRYDLFDYLALNRVAGLLILKNGEVVLEDYELGTGPETHWPSYSMAKSVSSTLIGAALRDGSLGSLDDPVTKYVPVLKGGAYEGVSVRNVMQMASGVQWNETYTDPNSDRRRLLEIQLQEKPGTILPFMSALSRAGAPGTIWNTTREKHLSWERCWKARRTNPWRSICRRRSGSRGAWSSKRNGNWNRRKEWVGLEEGFRRRCGILGGLDYWYRQMG